MHQQRAPRFDDLHSDMILVEELGAVGTVLAFKRGAITAVPLPGGEPANPYNARSAAADGSSTQQSLRFERDRGSPCDRSSGSPSSAASPSARPGSVALS
jgi:hypothetical protein